MAFDSFSAFLVMDGHGSYVWTCYGAFFLLIVVLVWLSVVERRQVVRSQRLQQQLQSSGRIAGMPGNRPARPASSESNRPTMSQPASHESCT